MKRIEFAFGKNSTKREELKFVAKEIIVLKRKHPWKFGKETLVARERERERSGLKQM